MLDDMVIDEDVHVVKDVKSILFNKIRLENKTETKKFKNIELQSKNVLLQ